MKIIITIEHEGTELTPAIQLEGSTCETSCNCEESTAREKESKPEVVMSRDHQARYDIASDLANVCEYLEEAEIMKLKLIIQKCEGRRKQER